MAEHPRPHAEDIRLDRVAGLGKLVGRLLIVWTIGGLLLAALGGSGFAEGAEGGVRLLSWLFVVLGLLVTCTSGLLLVLGRREGRAAVLSAEGIRLPDGREAIPWVHVADCDVRRSGGQDTLFAKFTPHYAKTAGLEGAPLGRIREGDESAREILRRIAGWRHAPPQ